jgi:glycosyltransferase involved in cell wall biosynthesis
MMPLTDAYGGFGGISKFNKDFLKALDACPAVERVHAIPRLIGTVLEDEPLPESVVYDRHAAQGGVAFIKRVWAHNWRADRVNLVICGHIHLLPVAWMFARFHKLRLALIIHGIEAWTPTRHKIANKLAAKVDSVIAVSRFSATRFASWSGFPADKAFILPNCVDLDQFRPKPRDPALVHRYGLASSHVIMTTARLDSYDSYKGVDKVILSMPHLLACSPKIKYLIVGDGSDRARLNGLVESLGLSAHVVFAGRISEAEKVAHYNLADAYVMPSTGEGFGIVLIEAAACGVPVIGSLTDGSQEALLGGRLGRLIDPNDRDALVQAVTETLAVPAAGRNPLIEHFSEGRFQERVACWLDEQVVLMGARSDGKRNILPRSKFNSWSSSDITVHQPNK